MWWGCNLFHYFLCEKYEKSSLTIDDFQKLGKLFTESSQRNRRNRREHQFNRWRVHQKDHRVMQGMKEILTGGSGGAGMLSLTEWIIKGVVPDGDCHVNVV